MRKTAVATVTALSLMAAPAFAQGQGQQEPKGQTTSPAKICSAMDPVPSKKKVAGTKGQSAWAGCVTGVKGHNADVAKNEQREAQGKPERKLNPARFCKAMTPALSKKKAPGDKKSPYAACVSGYAKAQNDEPARPES